MDIIKPNSVQNIINKFCYTIGMIPSSYKQSLTYEEQIMAIGNYLEEIVFPAINNNAEALVELQNLFIELKNYVENYFDNLDIQQEVDNKIEELLQSGQLDEIITSYLELNGILAFNTVNDLKNATNIINGSFTRTFGKVNYNDGEGAYYKIRNITSADVIDGINIISLNNYDTLIAEKIINLDTTPKVLESFYYYIDGENGNDNNDGLSNITAFKTIDKFLSLLNNGKTDIRAHILTSGNYHITSNINVFTNASIHLNSELTGENRPVIIFDRSDRSIAFYTSHINFQNIVLSQENPNTNSRLYFEGCTVGMTNVSTNIDKIAFQAGGIQIENLECNILQLMHIEGYIKDLKINNNDNTRNGVEINWCGSLRLYGNFIAEELEQESITENQALFLVNFSTVCLMFSFTNTLNNRYYTGLFANNSNVWITKNRYNALSKNGDRYSLNDPVLVNVNIYNHNNIDTEWKELDIISGTAGTGHYIPMYRIKNGILYLTGSVTGVNQGETIATLPPEITISNNRYTFVTSINALAEINLVRILENNNIVAFRTYGSNATVSLSGISIPLDY